MDECSSVIVLERNVLAAAAAASQRLHRRNIRAAYERPPFWIWQPNGGSGVKPTTDNLTRYRRLSACLRQCVYWQCSCSNNGNLLPAYSLYSQRMVALKGELTGPCEALSQVHRSLSNTPCTTPCDGRRFYTLYCVEHTIEDNDYYPRHNRQIRSDLFYF